MEYLDLVDTALFLFFNSFHNPFFDELMLWITNKFIWVPLYAFLIGFIIYIKRAKSVYLIVAAALLIFLSDRTTSGLMKPYFKRLRPCHESALASQMTLVGSCGGEYGMASSHAANTFAIATFVFLLFPAFTKYFVWLFPWALLVSFSRIYLGVHYPGDVVVGALIGAVYGVIVISGINFFTQRSREFFTIKK